MGGKGGRASAPDYTPIAQANREAAEISAQIAREQLAWAREQYAMDRQLVDRVIGVMLPALESEAAAGEAERARYRQVFQPVEDMLIAEARDYATPGRMELEASRAQADVAQAFEAQRRAALANLESYGIDPSTVRAGALDRMSRTAQAAALAGAANNARLQTEATGRALRGEAINIGRGYPGAIAQAYQTAQNAGQGAVGAGLAATASGANTMGTGVQWQGLSNQALANWGNQVASMNSAAMQANAMRRSGSGIGSILGGIAGLALSPLPAGGWANTIGGSIFNALRGG
jgi:hypothetical protein